MDLRKGPKIRFAAYAAMIIIITNPHTKNTITFILKFSGGLNGPVKRSQDKLRGLCIRLSGRHSTKTTETLSLEIPDPRMPWDPLRVPTHSGNHVDFRYCCFCEF